MNNDQQTPQDTTIHTLVIDEAYKENALKHIKNMVRGNKYDPKDVEIEKFEGEILHFQAENMLTIITKITQKTVPGRITGPMQVDNEIAAKEAMDKAYLTLTHDNDMQRKIRDVILTREDQGFALDNTNIALPFWKKEFVIFEPCHTCQTTGSVKCLPCAGKGIDLCPRCSGAGIEQCTHCNGAQIVNGPDNNNITCPRCSGNGCLPCTSCRQSGRIPCKTCGSKGVTICPNCQGNAWSSNIYILEIEARTAFDYPRDKLPEKIVALIEKFGHKIKEHADINISQAKQSAVNIEDEKKAKEQADADKKKNYRIPIIYEVFLPYGHIEYNINQKTYYTFLFGKHGKLEHVSPFLDDLLKNGIRKLHDSAELRGNVSDNIKQAAEYRTLKEGIYYAATHSLNKAKALLKKRNALGLSDKTIKEIIDQADIALKNITKKPRNVGLAYATFLNLIIFSTYFLSPLRQIFVSNLPNQNLHIIFDISILLTSLYLGIITIQAVSNSAIKVLMKDIGIKKPTKSKLGDKLYWNAGLSFVVFIIVIEISRRMTLSPPNWYMSLFS